MKNIIYLLVVMLFVTNFKGQDFRKIAEANAVKEKIGKNDIAKFVENQILTLKKIKESEKKVQTLPPFTTDICDDGGFETKDFSAWGWTAAMNLRGGTNVNFINYQPLSGSSTASTSGGTNFKWEIVNAGNDPLYPALPRVHSGNKSLKLGNNPVNYSAESILKTITVTAANSNLSFWYALVLEDPGHGNGNPFFGVRVHDGSSVNFVPILPIIGSMSTAPIVSDTSSFWLSSGNLRVRPWTCARVDLSKYIGKKITVEFVVSDCAAGGHFGYAYIDDICFGCQGSDMGDASISGISAPCGPSALVNGTYTLPNSNTATGTLNSLQAYLYQNGLPVAGPITIPNSYINTTSKTFNFPLSIFGTVPAGSYDIVIKANFTFSSSNFSTTSSTSGFISGNNNDWKTICPNVTNQCCTNKLQMLTPVPVPPSFPYVDGTYAVELYNVTIPSSAPITEIRIETTSFEWLDGPADCKQCQIKNSNLGSIFGGISIGGTMYGPASQPYGTGSASSVNNSEVVFSFPIPKMLTIGDFIKLTYVLPPEKDLACCQTKVKICRKITWKDINCGYCELYDCSIIDLKSKSELATGFPMPNLLMLYLNSRGIFSTGHAQGY